MYFADTFLSACNSLFFFLPVSFEEQEFLILKSILSIFFFRSSWYLPPVEEILT